MDQTSAPHKILIVDDDAQVRESLIELLQFEKYEVFSAHSGERAFQILREESPHLVILDQKMPDLNGFQFLSELRKDEKYISVIMLSGNFDTSSIVQGLDLGADDYLAKPYYAEELLARVKAHLRIQSLNDKLKQANEILQELAETDDLTGLLNMRTLYQKLDFELQRARRFQRQVAVVMMDMDFFKTVNDGHDHLFGSFVLSEVGKIVQNTIRNIDIGARYGGDEFLVVLTEVNEAGVQAFCERLRNNIANYEFKNGKDEIRLTASLGFCLSDLQIENIDPRSLVRTADMALYKAKSSGRNRVCKMEQSEKC